MYYKFNSNGEAEVAEHTAIMFGRSWVRIPPGDGHSSCSTRTSVVKFHKYDSRHCPNRLISGAVVVAQLVASIDLLFEY